jgi:hypothetical protein
MGQNYLAIRMVSFCVREYKIHCGTGSFMWELGDVLKNCNRERMPVPWQRGVD